MIHIILPNNGTHKNLVKRVINCKVCMRLIRSHIASQVGSHTSKKKVKSSRANGKLGGRPRKK